MPNASASHTERVQSALAERMSGFPLIAGPARCECGGAHDASRCPEAPWADPRVQDALNRAAHKAAARRFTGATLTGWGTL